MAAAVFAASAWKKIAGRERTSVAADFGGVDAEEMKLRAARQEAKPPCVLGICGRDCFHI